MYRVYVFLITLAFALTLQANHPAKQLEQTAPLNVVLILADDMGAHLGILGGSQAITPTLDALAQKGTLFRQAHAVSASCSPSRSAILTGMYPSSNGHWRNTVTPKIQDNAIEFTKDASKTDKVGVYPHIPTLIEILKEQGYQTGISQKWHLSPATKFPFDKRFKANGKPAQIKSDLGAFFDDVGHQPFFLQMNIQNTHRPYSTGDKSVDPSQLTMPDFFPDTAAAREDLAAYYAAVKQVDNVTKIVLDQLASRHLDHNTLIIFTSDHGWPYHRAKATSYYMGTHVPLIVVTPKDYLSATATAKTNDHLVSLIDLMPTILDMLSLPIPETVQGKSLITLLNNDPNPKWREVLFTQHASHGPGKHHWYPTRSAFDGNWHYTVNLWPEKTYLLPKDLTDSEDWGNLLFDSLLENKDAFPIAYQALLHTYKRPKEELYFIPDDTYSLTNLAQYKQYTEQREKLAKALQQHMRLIGDHFMPDQPD